jgi:hypothetical protein
MLGGRVRACLRQRRSSIGCSRTWEVGVRGARVERRQRAPPSRRRRLGSVPSVVPTEDMDASDVRACYPATYPGPRQGPAERDLPGASRPDRQHNGKL